MFNIGDKVYLRYLDEVGTIDDMCADYDHTDNENVYRYCVKTPEGNFYRPERYDMVLADLIMELLYF